jgi:hypothetical protein
MTVNRQIHKFQHALQPVRVGRFVARVQTHVRLTIENILKVHLQGLLNPGRLNRRVRWSNGERVGVA